MAVGRGLAVVARIFAEPACGRIDDVANHVVISARSAGEFNFVFHAVKGLQEDLGDLREDGGVARRDAVLGKQVENSAETLIDVGGGVEGAVEGGELVAAELRIAHFTFGLGVGCRSGSSRGSQGRGLQTQTSGSPLASCAHSHRMNAGG